jgi:hypothetical protein
MSPSDDLTFEPESSCLNIRALSRYILDEKEAAFVAMAGAIRKHAAKATLVDIRAVPGPYSFMDYIELGEMAGLHLSFLPVAVMAGLEQLDPERIGKVVAQNRGANVEVFTDLAEARGWLKKYLEPVV